MGGEILNLAGHVAVCLSLAGQTWAAATTASTRRAHRRKCVRMFDTGKNKTEEEEDTSVSNEPACDRSYCDETIHDFAAG